MTNPLRVLVVEDSEDDFFLIQRTLVKGGFTLESRRVESEPELRSALQDETWDLVLCDFSMPCLTAIEALAAFREFDLEIPFIVVSGSIGEERAVEMMRAGAHDVVMKDRISLLVSAVERELREAQVRRRQREAEEALARSEERFKTYFELGIIGMAIISPSKNWEAVNRRLCQILGYSREELLGKTLKEITHPEDLAAELEQIKALAAGSITEYECEKRFVRADGAIIHAHVAATCVRSSDGTPASYLLTVEDITRQLESERMVERLQDIVEQSPASIILTDLDGAIQYVNPAFEKVTGYTREEAIGNNPRMLKSGFHDRAFYRAMWETLRTGKTWAGQITNKKKDGTFYSEEANIIPARDRTGKIYGYAAVKRDCTERLMLESQLRQSQKMEALGTLAGGIAHDFNNILQGIVGYTEIVHESLENDEDCRTHLREVLTASQRATDLIQQILTFSRQGEQQRRPTPLHIVTKEALRLLRSTIPSTITIVERIDPHVPTVLADGIRVHQVLMNLCTNAAQAMRETGGTLTVELKECAVSSEKPVSTGVLAPGNYTVLSISDTGVGMEASIIERVFEPYFTTRKASGGTGLGLAVVHGIVREHDGSIHVESLPGHGTAFHVYFPASQATPLPEEEAFVPRNRRAGARGRVLCVDDEPSIVHLLELGLPRHGFEVRGFHDSRAAFDAFEAGTEEYVAAILDQTMPGLSGIELARRIHTLSPEIPIVLCTGNKVEVNSLEAKASGVCLLLPKPILLSKLVMQLEQLVGTDTRDSA
ncbi:MAG: hypothetical protein PWP23_2812 [Candidatus Sumerlaeota bacterium]|nr:hypothetical protein [Candidatus Sumerlaeota bacterium]